MLSRLLPLTIACLAALLPIRLTVCGHPLIWGFVETQAQLKINPDGGPEGECAQPSTFQTRVDGSWLPSSEFDVTGNFFEDCGLFLHLTIPEGEPEGGRELRSKIKQLAERMEELQKKEDHLLEEKKEHNDKVVELKNTTEQLNSSKEEIKVIEGEKKALNEKKEDLTRKRNSLRDKLNKLEVSDSNFTVEELKEKENNVTQAIADTKKEIELLTELRAIYYEKGCKPIQNMDYMIIRAEPIIKAYKQSDIKVCGLKWNITTSYASES